MSEENQPSDCGESRDSVLLEWMLTHCVIFNVGRSWSRELGYHHTREDVEYAMWDESHQLKLNRQTGKEGE